ncbi:MAG: hypothetical protein WCD24_05490 [Serratia inhibens]
MYLLILGSYLTVHFDEICKTMTANSFQISRSAIKKEGDFD